jgi:exopolysaccharide biosynthesis polyprenyl glycosylphosphotransferase
MTLRELTAQRRGQSGTRMRARPHRHGTSKPPNATRQPGQTLTENTTRRALVVGDVLVIVLCFALPAVIVFRDVDDPRIESFVEIVAISGVALVSIWRSELWSPRVVAVRMLELSRIPRVFGIGLVGVLLVTARQPRVAELPRLMLLGAAAIGAFLIWRAAHRAFVTVERRRGHLHRTAVIVGSSRRAFELHELFDDHPELGVTVVGHICDRDAASAAGREARWLGDTDEAGRLACRAPAEIVVVCAGGLDDQVLRLLAEDIRASGRTMLVDPGLPGLDFRQMHATAIAHQPLLELEPPALPAFSRSMKRWFDVAMSVATIVVALPLVLAVALAIKLEDRGPVFFRQRRVGQHGATFEILKFRTMVVGAEAKLAALQKTNERTGPLFKMDDGMDPRVTRIGRFLRSTSLDELPQLLNVLRGQMSLVGPRPALPSEVAQFPPDLLCRHEVRPGITGLWQVEARDHASFAAYRRLDVFYVANWSILLDMLILVATVDQLLFRPFFGRLQGRRSPAEPDVTEADAPAQAPS